MPNLMTDVFPKILSSALITLRESAVMPRLVNSDYGADAAKKGAVIQVPVPTALTAQDVVPGAYSQNTPDMQLDTAPIPLNYWKESSFQLSDAEIMSVMDGVPNMQIQEAAKAIANAVDVSLLSLYKGVANFVGTPGTTPFASSPQLSLDARKYLNKCLAPQGDRRLVMNSDAEANALGLPAFQYYLNSGDASVMREGTIGRKFGFDWYMDQNCPNHVAGTYTGGSIVTSNAPTSSSIADTNNPALRNPRTVNAVGFSGGTSAGTLNVGDVFSVAGDPQTYTITAPATASGGAVTVNFSPAAKVNWTVGANVTIRASHAINLAFHRDAIALAIRPLEQSEFDAELGGRVQTMIDPVTGIPLRLEVRREYKRVRFSLDCLWGVGLVRPENVARIAG